MEKVMFALRSAGGDDAWCARLRTEVAARVLDTGVPGLAVNVRDEPVAASLMTLTTLEPPVVAVVSVWTQQYYGRQVHEVTELLAAECDALSAYLVTESVPLAPPACAVGVRTDGLANVALLRRPADLDEATWLARWHLDHTPVAIATQATFGYVQNTVVRALTTARESGGVSGAPRIDAIVEELFPLAAVSDLHSFFGAADDADLGERMRRMLASTGAFGADRDVDTVPTSRYVLRDPFAGAADTLLP